MLLACWLATGITEADVTIRNVVAAKVVGIDLVNGTEQEMFFEKAGNDTLIKGIVLDNMPVLLRVETRK